MYYKSTMRDEFCFLDVLCNCVYVEQGMLDVLCLCWAVYVDVLCLHWAGYVGCTVYSGYIGQGMLDVLRTVCTLGRACWMYCVLQISTSIMRPGSLDMYWSSILLKNHSTEVEPGTCSALFGAYLKLI